MATSNIIKTSNFPLIKSDMVLRTFQLPPSDNVSRRNVILHKIALFRNFVFSLSLSFSLAFNR